MFNFFFLSLSTGYLIPLLCVLCVVLWISCVIVCVWWFRRRRKARQRENTQMEESINNQCGTLLSTRTSHKDNTDPLQENKNMLYPLDRVGDGAEREEEEEEGDEESDRGLVLHKCSSLAYTKGDAVYTIHTTAQNQPNRTHYSSKDNRCKNFVNKSLSEHTKDHYVWNTNPKTGQKYKYFFAVWAERFWACAILFFSSFFFIVG